MKRFGIILLGALVILMAGCSKNIEPSPSDPDAWKTDITLPVPIEFGIPTVKTKAELNFIDNLADHDKLQFGVFGINKATEDLSDPESFMLNNVRANSVLGEFKFPSTLYYPLTNECYNFYAYYKSTGTGNFGAQEVIPTEDKVYVRASIGDTDILYGSAKATGIPTENGTRDGFNGAYIRAVNKMIEAGDDTAAKYYPKFMFKHATAAVQIYITTTEEDKDYFGNIGKWIEEINLKNQPVIADLCVVDKNGFNSDSETDEGKFVPFENGIQQIYKRGITAGSQKLSPTYVTKADLPTTKLKGSRFLVPTTDPIQGYIILKNNTEEAELPFTIDLDLKAGYRYTVSLLIHKPENVTFEADVEGWLDGITEGTYDPENPGIHEEEIG